MTRLTIDPWDAEYGGSVELLDDLEQPIVDFDLEEGGWTARPVQIRAEVPRCAFLDGVRRIDVRLFADGEGAIAPALAGSFATGAAWSGDPPRIDRVVVGRALVVGRGMAHPELITTVGDQEVRYPCSSVAGTAPIDPILGLQNLMRRAEADLAGVLVEEGEAELFVLDGPLSYFSSDAPVLGLVKRQARAYLPPDRSGILSQLTCGSRTPLFRIHQQRLERYSWYVRIADCRRIDGVMTGIVRLEVSTELGAERALHLADLAASLLPRFASRIGRDPRAPQNLYPVGQLESELRRRLGDPLLLRRSLEALIWRSANA